MRYQTSTFKMADPVGTKTVEEAKKGKSTPDPDPGTQISAMLSPRRRKNQAGFRQKNAK